MKFIAIIFFWTVFPTLAMSQLSLNLRDSKYVGVSYLLNNGFGLSLEHSVFSQEISTQYVRGNLLFDKSLGSIDYKIATYYGMPYDAAYYNFGTDLSGEFPLNRTVKVFIGLNPHYDSFFKYKTCFDAGANFHLHKDVGIMASYSTKPEFRQNEKRIKVGLMLKVQNLSVYPYLSIPLEGAIKSFRLLVNLNYVFDK